MVSLFASHTGIGIGAITYQNKKASEIEAVRELIEQLKERGMIFTLDALHCQKKRRRLLWSQEMIM